MPTKQHNGAKITLRRLESAGEKTRLVAMVPVLAVLAACSTMPRLSVPTSPRTPTSPDRSASSQQLKPPSRSATRTTNVERLNGPGSSAQDHGAAAAAAAPTSVEAIAKLLDDKTVNVSIPPQPVGQFIDTVFGDLLKLPYVPGPGVAELRQVVTLRSSGAINKRTFFAMCEMVLRDYGVAVTVDNGVVRIAKNETLLGSSPAIIRSRTLPDTAEASRTVIQFFELQSIDANGLKSLLDDSIQGLGGVRVTVRQDINSIILVGRARDVAAAAQLITQIDQPKLAGAQVARIEPAYWSAERLAQAVSQALQTEGYQATAASGAGVQRAVTFMPVPFSNQVLLFSNIPQAFDRALYWVKELDRPAALGDEVGVFVYQVKNTGADELGRLAATVGGEQAAIVGSTTPFGGQGQSQAGFGQNQTGFGQNQSGLGQSTALSQPPRAAPSTGGSPASTALGARITVDTGSNRILYRGTPSEYERARNLFEQLDTPPLQVLIEITIAEVTLTDETRFGIEWFASKALTSGMISGGTKGGLGLSAGGLSISYDHATVQAALSAFANNNNVNILSTPRIVARSGGEANFQVGSDVPVITTQSASSLQVAGNSSVLQTVQYRQTGTIVKIQPIVFGDRVELNLSQEVSSQSANPNAAIGSPVILNRSVQTELSVKDGSTAIIGGLMSDNITRGNTGVPLLKDLPVVGSAFRADNLSRTKTELLILVTPHIVRSGDELADAADYYGAAINSSFAYRGSQGYTLLPWRGLSLEPLGQQGSKIVPGRALSMPPPAAAPMAKTQDPATEVAGGSPMGRGSSGQVESPLR